MKRVYVLLLALLLMTTGCSGNVKTKDVSVKDVRCPYEIIHKNGEVEITLQDGEKTGILWDLEILPEGICEVAKKTVQKEFASQYLITGKEKGIAQLTFTGLESDESVPFVLTLFVNVDSDGIATVLFCQHRERAENHVEEDGLNYKWSVDVDGVLHFSFIDDKDFWSASGDGEDICIMSNMMSTPVGYKFSASANKAGETTIVLVGNNTQRKINVVIQVFEDGKLEVKSVQEQ